MIFKNVLEEKINEFGTYLREGYEELGALLNEDDPVVLGEYKDEATGLDATISARVVNGYPEFYYDIHTASEFIQVYAVLRKGSIPQYGDEMLYLQWGVKNTGTRSVSPYYLFEFRSIRDRFAYAVVPFFANYSQRPVLHSVHCWTGNLKKAKWLRDHGYERRRGFSETFDKVFYPDPVK